MSGLLFLHVRQGRLRLVLRHLRGRIGLLFGREDVVL